MADLLAEIGTAVGESAPCVFLIIEEPECPASLIK